MSLFDCIAFWFLVALIEGVVIVVGIAIINIVHRVLGRPS